MATFHIVNFGCRATQADAAAIERQLLERGYSCAHDARDAQAVVLNTCTVTADADSVARQAIRRVHRENPAARIVVTGCYAQRAPDELAQIAGVSWVVGNSHKPEIPDLVAQALLPVDPSPLVRIETGLTRWPVPPAAAANVLVGDIFALPWLMVAPVVGGEGDHTRPVLKIQDGCNNRCSFCVIPFVRGRSRSLAPRQVVEEILKLTGAGYQEVVLSGINLGSYGRDLAPRVELQDLIRRILDKTPLARLRLSSVEPMDITRDLVDLVAASDRIARHFHVPLQSGSDRILKAMHRWYRAEHYARRIQLIRERLPGAGIGADVIAGFPSETDDDHRATLRLIESLPFTYLHVFAYSRRPGTRAAGLPGGVAPLVIKQRSKDLRAIAAAKSAAFRAAQIGQSLRVLTLRRQGGGFTEAISDNYLKVRVAGAFSPNKFLDVRITANAGSHLLADCSV